MGRVATSPLPSRGSPPLHSAGARSQMAHLWAKWLRHHCRLRDPHRFRAGGGGGGIRSGPQVGKVATSPLPSQASPPLQSGGQDQKWPTCGQSGYVTPAVSGIPTASERGAKSEVAHKWAKWLRRHCRLRDPHRCRAGGKIRSGPLVGKVATSPLPSRGSPPLQSGWQDQKWPTCGQSGYVTPDVSGVPTASDRRAKSEVAHLWAKWLRHHCRLRDPHRCKAGGKIRSGPLVGKVATSPPPSRGSPPLQSGGQDQKWPTSGQSGYVTLAASGIPTAAERGGNHKWPTSGQSGYVTPAVSGIATASERGARSEVADLWAKWLRQPCHLGDPHRFRARGKSEVAHKWTKWLRHPCRLGDPHRFRAGGGGIRSGPQVGKVATPPLPSRGSPPLQSGGQDQKWPTCGQSGYVTPAVSGIPTASERGARSEVAHLWAKWLRHPCRLGDPQRCGAGGKIRSGPLVGKVANAPLPSRGSPPLQTLGGNQKWPSCGQSGYVTPAVSGIPTAAERGARSEVAHLWAKWLTHPCRLGDPHRFRAGGGNSEVAHKWAKWLRHPCHLRDPHRFRAGGEIRSGPQVGKVATSPLPSRGSPPLQSAGEIRSGPQVGKVATPPLPSRGSPPLQSGGQNQKWPTSGQSGYVTPAVSGIPTASERGGNQKGPQVGKVATSPLPSQESPPLQSGGGKSEVAHKWAKWLRHPCRLGDPHRFRPGGGNSEVAHKWAKWLRHHCRLRDPHRFKAGGEIRSGPQVGKVATSPLPSRGSPPLQTGGQNQKWPTSGQSGYVTPAVSGIPTASERGGKSQVAHLWAKWLCQPCRLGDPHRFRAGGKSEVAHLWAKWLRHPCRLGDPHRCRASVKVR